MAGYMVAIVVLCGGVCYLGVQAGVERITKSMMSCLLVLMVVLAIHSVLLPGGEEGLRYYLYPDFGRLAEFGLKEVIFAAMGQAFFTLSIGIGALAIFGSYIGKTKRLTGEAVWVVLLDTFVAIMAGLIIFPACFAYGVDPASGPNLLFISLPNVFNAMPLGRLWGTMFFLFMTFASFSTVTAVFENLIAALMDCFGWSRKKSVTVNLIFLLVASLPCALGYNLLSNVHLIGTRDILDSEDFIVSNLLLPIGSLIFTLFCVTKLGWGFDNYLKEVNKGRGMKLSRGLYPYLLVGLPLLILVILVSGLR